MQEIVFKIFAESFDRFSTVINRHVNRKELPLHKEQKNMRKLKITELNRISAEEFKKYASITDYDNDNWKMATVNSDGSEVWIYMTAVEAGESTEALFNNVTVNTGITEEWSSAAKATTIYKCDAYGNKLSIIDTTKEQYDPTVIYKDADGNIVSAGTLPTFNIKVTGFAVQASTFADYNEAQPELIKLVNSKTSADAQF